MAHFLLNFAKKSATKGKPLRDQAAKLLDVKLWGIGPRAPNKDALAPGDRVLAYVGAPENLFVGQMTIAKGFHDWTPEEAPAYAQEAAGGGFPAGVTFGDAEIFEKPVPIDSVWSQMPASETNPPHLFRGGIVRIKEEDFEIVVSAAAGATLTPSPPRESAAVAPSAAATMIDALYAATERLKSYLASSPAKPPSEDATRAMFINDYVRALGYTDFEDVDYGVPVEGQEADYVYTRAARKRS